MHSEIGMVDESKTGASIAVGPNRGVGPEKKSNRGQSAYRRHILPCRNQYPDSRS